MDSVAQEFETQNIAQRPVAPWHTSILVGLICGTGLFVMPTKTTESCLGGALA
jgi:hypothetical protein